MTLTSEHVLSEENGNGVLLRSSPNVSNIRIYTIRRNHALHNGELSKPVSLNALLVIAMLISYFIISYHTQAAYSSKQDVLISIGIHIPLQHVL